VMAEAEFSLTSLSFHKKNVTHENRICKRSKMSFTLMSVFFSWVPSAQIARNLFNMKCVF